MVKKILIIFGTRPEAIKMAPLIKEFQKYQNKFETRVCISAQHRNMLDQVLDFFEINAYYDLDLMKSNQNLYDLTADIISNLKPIFEDFNPDFVFVHGDTTTTMSASIAAYYSGVKVCHVEAGLRTYNKLSPFPEEINRQITSRISDYHFAPTIKSKQNLLIENISEESILVTGNTVLDSLNYTMSKLDLIKNSEIDQLNKLIEYNKNVILVTVHRRENHGGGLVNICEALKRVALEFPDIQIIYPVHPNPNVKNIVFDLLSNIPNLHLIAPLSYPAFVWLMNRAYLIVTDSGGIQEEAPSLGKPVLLVRETSERPEAIEAGTVLLVGVDANLICLHIRLLITDKDLYNKMSDLHNPYGDGNASRRIVSFISNFI